MIIYGCVIYTGLITDIALMVRKVSQNNNAYHLSFLSKIITLELRKEKKKVLTIDL